MRALWYSPVMGLFLLTGCQEDEAEHGGKAPVYTGQSAHWDQQQVPISLRCAACHQEEFEKWAGSDHAWAWRTVDPALDTEPFHGQQLSAHGEKLAFRTDRQGKPLIILQGETPRTFPVHSVLGRTPLVQYLVEGKDGGLHTPSAAWDVLRREWFDMFEDDKRLMSEGGATRAEGDWGHWLGRGMNWNSQCAWCHMSGFRKNYDPATDRYSSTWQEPGVTCIQCHKMAATPAADGCLVAPADRVLTDRQNHDNCASCHARREELDDQFCVGDKFDDHFRLEMPLLEGIFYPNGMQRDEDYCETGLRLSTMGNTGVTCKECHDPHSGALILPQEDDSLCMRCHADGTEVNGTAATIIDPATHSPCTAAATAAGKQAPRCVDCHMPESPYMARDPRRDHSVNMPDPALSAELGIPNACNMCHTDKDAAWAAEACARTYPAQKTAANRPRTRAVQAAMLGQPAADELLRLCRAEPNPAWRSVLLELAARQQPSAELFRYAQETAAKDAHPMVRAAAARILRDQSGALCQDPVRLVRQSAARSLSERFLAQPQAADSLRELERTATHQADQPVGAMQLAAIASIRGDYAEAERQYRRALRLDPASSVVYKDFAVFLARRNRLMDALQVMLECTAKAPEDAEAQYRLGLLLYELRQYPAALKAFEKAAQLEPQNAEYQSAHRQLRDWLNPSSPS